MLVKALQAPAAINIAQRHDQEHVSLKKTSRNGIVFPIIMERTSLNSIPASNHRYFV